MLFVELPPTLSKLLVFNTESFLMISVVFLKLARRRFRVLLLVLQNKVGKWKNVVNMQVLLTCAAVRAPFVLVLLLKRYNLIINSCTVSTLTTLFN
jgi:hypothetical protein